VAATALQWIFGSSAASVLAVMIMVSTFGAANGMILTGPRIPFAMGKDGVFFHAAGRVHPKTHTPVAAIVIQGLWSCVLCSVGTFQQLITYAVFTVCIFFVLAAMAVMRLRKTRPDLHRPFRVPLYPLLPIVTLIANAALVINTIVADVRGSAIGIAMVLLGLPAYFVFRWKNGSVPAQAFEAASEG
jgi:APA family basic amino acid/polyamine antiporter